LLHSLSSCFLSPLCSDSFFSLLSFLSFIPSFPQFLSTVYVLFQSIFFASSSLPCDADCQFVAPVHEYRKQRNDIGRLWYKADGGYRNSLLFCFTHCNKHRNTETRRVSKSQSVTCWS
jgi:hypothetical protein